MFLPGLGHVLFGCPKFAAAKKKTKNKKPVVRPGSGVRPRLIRGEGTVAVVDC